ncbi:MAG: Glu-tRNA(Gln) amidotransferase subunit GatD [Candidatus Pacearchaeota archaeon]
MKIEKNISFGDKIKVITSKEDIEGTFIPSSDSSLILIKLDSGYNIGIKKEDIINIELIEKFKKEEEKIKIEENKNLPYIDLIITGGTISSKVDYKTGGVSWITKPEELFKFYPEIFNIVNINQIKIPFMKASENMCWEDWKILAKEVESSLNNKNIKGIIITHGTDFLHYTSTALSFFLKDINKPVVLTYAQRSSDRASSDAEMNLLCSAYTALSDIAEVVVVGHATINDDYCYVHRGTKVRKLHASRRDAFKSVNEKPIAKVFPDGKIEILSFYNKRDETKKVKLDLSFEENVFLLKFFPGLKSEVIDYLSSCYKGIILEGSGLGHVAIGNDVKENLLPSIKKAINNGTIICMTTQTLYGRVDEYVYSPARELEKIGVIYLKDMLPEVALIKLSYVLGKTSDIKRIKELMLRNISGEFNERLEE